MSMPLNLQNALNAEMDKVLGCIHCGLCLPACPTYQQTGNENDSPRGRIYLMRAVAEGKLDADNEKFNRHIDLCLGCRACETACPAGVNYGFLLEAARYETLKHENARTASPQKRGLSLALRHLFPYPGRLSKAMKLSRWMRSGFLLKLLKPGGLLHSLAQRVNPQSDFSLALLESTKPVFARAASGRSETLASRKVKNANDQSPAHTVSLFTGCVMDGLFKHTNDATARVLAANHCTFAQVTTQVCCGALHAHSGDLETARELARRNIEAFEKAADEKSVIIINSAGCGALLKEYGELLKHDAAFAERAHAFSKRVKDISEFLTSIGPRTGAPLEQKVTYDAPCHLYHAQRITAAPQQLLKTAIPDLKFIPLEGLSDCCGGAGIYNLSEPEMSEKILTDKIARVKATDANLLLTANPGCHMQLGAGVTQHQLNCRVAHVIELVDESYRRAGFYE
jgi:glycolate oxidase iron-sulfur subunit